MWNKQNKTKYTDYPQWREVAFYEYVREFIVKKKIKLDKTINANILNDIKQIK